MPYVLQDQDGRRYGLVIMSGEYRACDDAVAKRFDSADEAVTVAEAIDESQGLSLRVVEVA